MSLSSSSSHSPPSHREDVIETSTASSSERGQSSANGYMYGSTLTWTNSADSLDSDKGNNLLTSTLSTSTPTGSSPSASSSSPSSPSIPSRTKCCPPFRVNPKSRTAEPFRDFDGPFTLYRLLLLVWILAMTTLFYMIQQWIWPPDPNGSPYSNEWYAQPHLSLILLTPVFLVIVICIGAISFRFPTNLDNVPFTSHRVVFRIVSRGINNDCLMQTIRACQRVMNQNSLFPYLIEIVTDADVFEAPSDDDVIQLKVPIDYHPQNGTLFKARALHYACEESLVPNNSWVVHLDEETHITSSGVKGIADFVANCEQTGDVRRIGQGCILYDRAWRQHKFLTMADMRRTGDDFGCFYLQHRLGVTLFGLHGAYVVCRSDAEKEIGFDLGPDGSITEDAWWALIAMSNGNRFKWVDGYLEEQSTQSISDFLKQRRRWHYGLLKVVVKHPVRIRYRLFFMLFFLLWFFAPFISPIQVTYILVLIYHDLGVPLYVRIPTLVIVSFQLWSYVIGWIVNIREGMPINKFLVPVWTIIIILLYPVFQILECVALLMAFFAEFSESAKGFHVVQKSVINPDGHHPKGYDGGRLLMEMLQNMARGIAGMFKSTMNASSTNSAIL